MECGLQGGFSVGYGAALLSAHRHGSRQPVSTAVPGGVAAHDRGGATVVGVGVSRIWAAGDDPDGQRPAICLHGARGPESVGGVVGAGRHSARTDSAGTPSENGCHERMHRALKAAVGPPAATLAAQQRRLAMFVEVYNWARSHEALNRQTPGQVYQPSPRPYPAKLPPIEYAPGTLVRQVRHNGEIRWRGHTLYLSEVLVQEPWASRRSGRAPGRSIIVFIGWGPWMPGR